MRNTGSLKRVLSLICVMTLLTANTAACANPLDDVGNWFSDRAEDVSGLAGQAGGAIENSGVGQFIGENASKAGEWISGTAAAAGEWISDKAATAGIWISDNAEIAGSFIGENLSTVYEWLGDKAALTGDWIIENGKVVGEWIVDGASGAGLWIGENASAAGTMIGETVTGAGVWINEKVTDIGEWINENAVFSEDGIVILGDKLGFLDFGDPEYTAEVVSAIQDYVSNIDTSKYLTKEYYLQTGEKLLLGDYSDSDETGLCTALNIVANVVQIDSVQYVNIAMDLRDLIHDIQYIGDGNVGIVDLGIDAVSCIPEIGVIGNVADFIQAAEEVAEDTGINDAIRDDSSESEELGE